MRFYLEIQFFYSIKKQANISKNEMARQYTAIQTCKIAIDKAKKLGLGMVAVKNSTHYGIAGFYTGMAS